MIKGFAYLSVISIMLALGVYQYSLTREPDKGVNRSIQIKGVFLLVDQADLLARLNQLSLNHPEQGDFVGKVSSLLESEPYVSSSSIRYGWPNTMIIEIVEIAPLAIVNGRYLMLKKCRLIEYDPAAINVSAQALYLDGDTVGPVQCREISKALAELESLHADSVSIQSNGDYVLSFAQAKLVIDNAELPRRLATFADIADRIKKHEISAKYIDTRYVSGAAIAQVTEL